MHKKTYLHIPHQIFECRSTNTIRISYLSFISTARIQYDIFYNPRAQRTGVLPTQANIAIQTERARVCREKLEKNPTDPRTHT